MVYLRSQSCVDMVLGCEVQGPHSEIPIRCEQTRGAGDLGGIRQRSDLI